MCVFEAAFARVSVGACSITREVEGRRERGALIVDHLEQRRAHVRGVVRDAGAAGRR